MHTLITQALEHIEQTESVKILYACESGSRAWGFESTDSDYDVRFIYVRPLAWYLSVPTPSNKRRNVLEYPANSAKAIHQDLDISGWDLQKALSLMAGSNPPLLEWLGSPIVYRETLTTTYLQALARTFYTPHTCAYHYLHMAWNNWRQYMSSTVVWTKKYFYVLRPVLAVQWIEQGLGVVPTEFSALVERLVTDPALRQEIDALLEQKKAGAELRRGPRNEILHQFLESELNRHGGGQFAFDNTPRSTQALDRLFMQTVLGEDPYALAHLAGNPGAGPVSTHQ